MSKGIGPHIINTDTTWRQVVNLMHRQHYIRYKRVGMDPQKETTVHNDEHILLCLSKVPNQKHGYRKCNCLMAVTVS